MTTFDFIVQDCTSLRYFMPIVIEGNKQKIQSNFYLNRNNKYNCPFLPKNLNEIKLLANAYNINLLLLKEDKIQDNSITFLVEGVGREFLNCNALNVSLTYMTDFTVCYRNYVKDENIHYVIFPNKFFAEYYNDMKIYPPDGKPAGQTISSKNVYLGSPKYDIDLKRYSYFKKLPNTPKTILIIAPNSGDLKAFKMFEKLHKSYIEKGYTVLVKSRGKSPVSSNLRGTFYFEDDHWFPHTTMVLIKDSDLVISFGSTVTKECIMVGTPFIDINFKNFKHLDFLCDKKACLAFDEKVTFKEVVESTELLLKKQWKDEIKALQQKYLFDAKSVSKKIIEFCLNMKGEMA